MLATPLSAPSWIHDAEDDDSIVLTAVQNGVMSKCMLPDARWTCCYRAPNLGKLTDSFECLPQNGPVRLQLLFTPSLEGVLENIRNISLGLILDFQINT